MMDLEIDDIETNSYIVLNTLHGYLNNQENSTT